MSEYLPTEKEIQEIHGERDFLLSGVQSLLSEEKIDAKVMAVGSTAKDTFVKGDLDIDIFIGLHGH